MIGFGTEDADLLKYSTKFASLLGSDGESWGLSYMGNVMHNGVKRSLFKGFSQGATIGIHMDMWHGRMSVFKNGKYVGKYVRKLCNKSLTTSSNITKFNA